MKFIIKSAGPYAGTTLDLINFPITVEGKFWGVGKLVDVMGSELIRHGALTEAQDPFNGYDPEFGYCFELGTEIEYAEKGE